jgi:predicted MPP superfamily phosphohydrolase
MSIRISRRGLLVGAAATAAGALATDAFAVESRRVYLTRHDIAIPGLPPALDGFRIAQISDVHLHGGMHAAARATIALIAAERPEITLLTGDICERKELLSDVTAFTRECQGRMVTLALMGNWEYAAGISPSEAASAYSAGGAELLVNRTGHLKMHGARLNIVGLDDPVRGFPDLREALAGVLPADVTIWAYHAPGLADELPRESAPAPTFMVAGHTHGGQIRLPLMPAVLPFGSGRFVEGWYRDTSAPLYVSRGVGTTTIRARFRCPAEVPVFTLRRSKE